MTRDYHGAVRRFIHTGILQVGQTLPLEGALRHRMRVTRVAHDSLVLLLDQSGTLHRTRVRREGGQWFLCSEAVESSEQSPAAPELLLALCRPEALRRSVRAAVELGCPAVHLLRAQRSQRGADDTLVEGLQRVSLSAVEQCQADSPATILTHVSLSEALASLPLGIMTHPAATMLGVGSPSPIVAIGPEGGWTDEELQEAVEAGWSLAALPGHTLRVETAVVAALSLTHRCSLPGPL